MTLFLLDLWKIGNSLSEVGSDGLLVKVIQCQRILKDPNLALESFLSRVNGTGTKSRISLKQPGLRNVALGTQVTM